MIDSSFHSRIDRIIAPLLCELEQKDMLRNLPRSGSDYSYTNRIDLLSNDYLGLAAESPRLSASASRLLCKKSEEMFILEDELKALYKKEALVFNSGYHANVGVISSIAQLPSTIFICDKQVHASVIDGLTLGLHPAKFIRYAHNDIRALEKSIQKVYPEYDNIVIVTEGIFSMSGETAPLKEIVALRNKYDKLVIYLDEAHSFGTRGNAGLGLAEELDVIQDIDIQILTFGKAAASSGAAVMCSDILKSWLVNSARSLIFSTALPPAQCTHTLNMIHKIVNMNDVRIRLQNISRHLKGKIEEICDCRISSDSHIIPFTTGDAHSAIELAKYLQCNNIDAMAIRRPTVQPGKEGVRLSLCASLSDEDVQYIIETIKRFTPSINEV